MTALRRYGLVSITVLALAGCGHSTSSTYEAADVGRTIETTRGQVVSSRPVNIAGESNVVGPAAGAALGGAGAAGAFGKGWITIIGAVVGAGAGYAAQQFGNSRDGIEYIVQMEDGRTVTLVQNKESGETPIANGTPVLVQISGKYTRVVPDPRSDAARTLPAGAPAPATSGWVDPDAAPGATGSTGSVPGRPAPGGTGTYGGTPGGTYAGPPVIGSEPASGNQR